MLLIVICLLILVGFILMGMTCWIMVRRGWGILPRGLEGRLKVCVWVLIIFFIKGVVIRISRMESLVPADRMSVVLKGGWWVLHAG